VQIRKNTKEIKKMITQTANISVDWPKRDAEWTHQDYLNKVFEEASIWISIDKMEQEAKALFAKKSL